MNTKLNKLTKEEERIILKKGTEAQFTGEYENHYEDGIYTCKNCGKALYKSTDKFHSNCGWPSFDDEIEGAVKKTDDEDGQRTEITCNNCGGHLGHVFIGENLTEKNTRHCVNSMSLKFIKENEIGEAIFAAGCFWGVEYYFQKLNEIISTEVGYTGGKTKNPSYEEVCNKETGHYEAIKINYNKSKITYEDIVKYFFEIHDFEQENGQGPDIGEQYKSIIFYKTDEEKNIAEKIINLLKEKNYKVATKLKEESKFWPAEKYHQNYYNKKENIPYCHKWKKIF
jgi:peptide methionine sulfoxide reductase msrA/msrB